MADRPIITLLTDFGLEDAYVGVLKGVIARWAPDALVIDICHAVPPQDIRRAGLIWAAAIPWFPPGTIHVAVVDPGVGGRRKILAFEGKGAVFLAPDNGLVGYVLQKRQVKRVVEVRRRALFLEPVSSTFHGRDIFAPVAARLATGLDLSALGPSCRRHLREELPRSRARRLHRKGRELLEVRGEIVYVDRFGNAVTNLQPPEGLRLERLEVGGSSFPRMAGAYAEAPPGSPLVILGSMGTLEVAVNQGRAVDLLSLRLGDRVTAAWIR